MMMQWLVLLSLLSFAPGDSPAPVLTGTVTDPDGRPVAGISLWAVFSFEQVGATDLPPSAVSGPDGSFSIAGLPPGRIDLYACGAGYQQDFSSVWSLAEPVHLEVVPATTVRGRVVGPDGDPAASAFLVARDLSEYLFLEPGEFPPIELWTPCPSPDGATSEADGRFEIGSLPPGRYDLDAYLPGLTMEAPHLLQIDEEGLVEGIEIRLQTDGSRTGRLTDPDGAPVEGGHVTLTEEGEKPFTYLAELDGSFRFFADPGVVVFQVEAEGYEPLERTIEISDEETPVELLLVRDESWTTVRGRVSGPGGAPVEGADVSVPWQALQTTTAADGSFVLPISRQEPREIHVVKEGLARGVVPLDLEAPPVGEGTIRLEPGAVVTGRLPGLTPADRGPATRVTLHRSIGPDLEVPLRIDGSFRFEHVPAGAWKLIFKGGGRSAMKRVIVKPGQAEVAVDLPLPAPKPDPHTHTQVVKETP